MEFLIPLFAGVFCTLFFCVFIGVSYGFFPKPEVDEVVNEIKEDHSSLFLTNENVPDLVLESYRNNEYKEWVVDFFSSVCKEEEIAKAILDSCDEFNVPPALAFALCWEESRFVPHAINRRNRNGSIDRGLFQLNNFSFPQLDVISYYNIQTNTRYGIGYLRDCLNYGDTEISALAMYNAGSGRVRSTGAPEVTLNYVARILENRRKIETRFHSRLLREEEKRMLAEN
jgi:hypothetical protein